MELNLTKVFYHCCLFTTLGLYSNDNPYYIKVLYFASTSPLLYPLTKVGDILVSHPSRKRMFSASVVGGLIYYLLYNVLMNCYISLTGDMDCCML